MPRHSPAARRRAAPSPAHEAPSVRRRTIVAALLAGLTWFAFAGIRDAGFVQLDDPAYVSANPRVADGLTPSAVAWAFTTFDNANWHPLTWLSHLLDVSIFGLDPAGHHLTSLLLHTASVVLLFLVLHAMTGALARSAGVAALFAVHPMHVESVAWISERKDVLSTLFWIATMGAYLRYTRAMQARDGRPAGARLQYLAVAGLFALGLLAKPMLVTLPFVLLLLDIWPLGRAAGPAWIGARGALPWRVLVLEKLPLLALSVASSIVTLIAQQHGGAVRALDEISVGARVQNAIVSYAGYLERLVWPADLAPFYPYRPLAAATVAVAALVLVAITIAVVVAARRTAAPLIGWAWYLGTLVPVIGLVQVGRQAMADRYTYVPFIGLFVAIAWALPRAPARPMARVAAAAAVVVAIAASVVATRAQVQHWQSSAALWQRTIAVTLDIDPARAGRAVDILTTNGTAGDALAALFRVGPGEARRDLGLRFLDRGNLADAAALLREATVMVGDAISFEGLGRTLALQGDLDGAVAALTEAVRLAPALQRARANLGRLLGQTGRFSDAEAHLAEAVRLNAGDARARCDLGLALFRLGRLEDAAVHLQTAVGIDPTLPEGHNNLGLVRAAQQELPDARRHFQEAVRLQPGYLDALRNLGVAHLKLGEPDAARAAFEAVLSVLPNDATAREALAFLKR